MRKIERLKIDSIWKRIEPVELINDNDKFKGRNLQSFYHSTPEFVVEVKYHWRVTTFGGGGRRLAALLVWWSAEFV